MNLNCVICSDLFVPTADIYTTQCGHIFHYHCLLHWLENSKTCPQCRAKASPKTLMRLFLNVCSSENPRDDATVLQYKLDGVDFQMKLKDKDISNLTAKKNELKKQNAALRMEIKKMQVDEITHQSAIAALKDQVKFFKVKSVQCDELRVEIGQLKNQIKDLEHVQTAVTGSRQQVNDIIRNENSVESLALLAATLKKSLVDADRKKREYQFELKKTQNEYSRYRKDMEERKCEFEDTKRQLESLKSSYEREVTYLKNKFSQLESKVQENNSNESLNSRIRRIVNESPINCNRTPAPSLSKSKVIDLTTPPISSLALPKIPKLKALGSQETEADSPLPAPNLGPLGIQRSLIGTNSDDKFSIFKSKSTSQLEPLPIQPKTNSLMGYNGLGSSSKEDIFPSPQKTSAGLKRPRTAKISSAKFKKLSADAGKVKKVTNFF